MAASTTASPHLELSIISKELRSLQGTTGQVLGTLRKVHATARLQSLQWAVSNAEVNSFNYTRGNDDDDEEDDDAYVSYSPSEVDSTALVQAILLRFIAGRGYVLPKNAKAGRHDTNGERKQEFRSRLSWQIECLTGVKPRFEEDDDGDLIIFHS